MFKQNNNQRHYHHKKKKVSSLACGCILMIIGIALFIAASSEGESEGVVAFIVGGVMCFIISICLCISIMIFQTKVFIQFLHFFQQQQLFIVEYVIYTKNLTSEKKQIKIFRIFLNCQQQIYIQYIHYQLHWLIICYDIKLNARTNSFYCFDLHDQFHTDIFVIYSQVTSNALLYLFSLISLILKIFRFEQQDILFKAINYFLKQTRGQGITFKDQLIAAIFLFSLL